MSGKLDGRSYAGTLENFQSTHIGYRAHRAVIFAIAWHLVSPEYWCMQHIRSFLCYDDVYIYICYHHYSLYDLGIYTVR